MRGLRLVAAVLLAAQLAQAQPPRLAVEGAEAEALARRYRAARLRRNVGWALAGVALASVAAGVIAIRHGMEVTCNPSCYDDVILPSIIGGSITAAVGGGLGVAGLALALQGQWEMTEAQWRMGLMPEGPVVPPARRALALGWSFRF